MSNENKREFMDVVQDIRREVFRAGLKYGRLMPDGDEERAFELAWAHYESLCQKAERRNAEECEGCVCDGGCGS